MDQSLLPPGAREIGRSAEGAVFGTLTVVGETKTTEATDMRNAVIEVEHLHKSYGGTVAVDDVSFTVEQGEIFGILGRNGAGKTTTVECLVGLRKPDRGSIQILGRDPQKDHAELTRRVGVQLQDSQLPERLRVGEAIRLYQSFYPDPADSRELLAQLGLKGREKTPYGKLSGGQKQRLSIALALIGRPRIAILDELTTGLDPHARRDTWDLITDVRASGVTIVLVTHFMPEAERLCDRIAVIDGGRVKVSGTPAELIARAGQPTLEDAFVTLTGRNS
jgi:ABC-2 type transport system ATP-binding protein